MDVEESPANRKGRVPLRVRSLSSVLFLAAWACASPGTPPGGPVDTQAPQVVRIAPDSGRTGTTPREVIFRFDEVVSERPAGAASLAAMFLISPSQGEPRVDWNRNEIAVRPRRGWRPNTAYTITMLPGISDLRGNVRNTGQTTVFSTGSTIPPGRIHGTLFDWVEARALARALVHANPVDDTSLVYVTTTDSVGAFAIANLPAGSYRVRGILDANGNRALDPREAWDSAIVQLADSASIELLAFVRDSVGTRLQTVNVRDSVTLELVFDNPLSVAQPLTAANISVRGADSVDVPVASVAPPPVDTTVAAGRRPSRPAPARSMIVKLGRRLAPGAAYRVAVREAANLIGVVRSSDRAVTIPQPQPVTPPSPVTGAPAAPRTTPPRPGQ
jgi:hypothetical protein